MATVLTKIGDIRRKLDACLSLRNAQDSAARVYDDAAILVESSKNAMEEAEMVIVKAALAVEAAIDAKEAAATTLKRGATDLMNIIKDSRKVKGSDQATNQKNPISGQNVVTTALDACLQVREGVNAAARITKQMEIVATQAAEVESIYTAALNVAETAWIEKVRIYNDAVAAAEAAQAAMIEAASIIR